ncbi:receptor-like serine/threonine-protein kinase SD1-8 [Zingiber officinale]|uniref:receptor-like serine/threonine-protein kinase SD1-8 n=1 Tax=Zingiber officinale TaxID=94328 RepID=UPI001C4D4717|nr:receptor-like serine/threonine-protein kinase SD1-8 [Zingiber officinale]
MRLRSFAAVVFFPLLLLAATLVAICSGADRLAPDLPLLDDGASSLVSDSGRFRLGFFSPNGSVNRYVGVWYAEIPVQTVVWIANREQPVTSRFGNLSMTRNGTLVLVDGSASAVIWSTASFSPALVNPVAQLLDDGNFVVREEAEPDGFAWQSFDFLTDTFIPGMMLGQRKLRTGRIIDIKMASWASDIDPAPGRYSFGLDVQGDPQLFLWYGTRPHWRAGSWNGRWLSGVPEVKDRSDGLVDFDVEPNQVTYLPSNKSTAILRWVVHNSGHLQLVVWLETQRAWNVIWYVPKDLCDSVSSCGPNGYCRPSSSPVCACLQGFHPKNPRNWELLDGSDGCVRTTTLDCQNGTDGFWLQSGTKLPDTARATVNASLSLEQCKELCLKNCSCRAYAASNISSSGSGSGCIIWATDLTDITVYQGGLGQDLYVKLAAADLASEPSPNHSLRKYMVVMLVILPLAIIFLACVAYFIWRKKRSVHISENAEEKNLELPLFDLSTIRDATDNFSIDNKLGEGGFGPVYKGKLEDDREIAVKRLSNASTQGAAEFKNEVTLIAKLQHRNLVRLLGCCIQGGERMLIYEYMANGSLDAILFDEHQGALLDWTKRYKIILGIARGLLYLHHDSRLRIIHRDLKASNVLLDKEMNPKISDFGMARIFGGEESEANTKRVVGTYGYMAPEYVMDGIFSVKSDVYSFGVLVLEMVTGQKNRSLSHTKLQLNLLGHIWMMWKQGKCLDLVDKNVGRSFSEDEVLRCAKIGLLCVQESPIDRPTISSVLTMLGSMEDDISLIPEPKQPGFFSSADSYGNSAMRDPHSLATERESFTELEGR